MSVPSASASRTAALISNSQSASRGADRKPSPGARGGAPSIFYVPLLLAVPVAAAARRRVDARAPLAALLVLHLLQLALLGLALLLAHGLPRLPVAVLAGRDAGQARRRRGHVAPPAA